MKRFVVSAFLFLLLGQTIGAQNKFALLVGINQYQIKDSSGKIVLDPKNALSGCVNDVISMKTLLINKFNFQASNIVTLYNTKATRENILKQIDLLNAKCQRGDVAVVYYAGHGMPYRYGNGIEDIAEVILPTNSFVTIPFSCIQQAELAKKFNLFVDKQVTLTAIFDCCFSMATNSRGILMLPEMVSLTDSIKIDTVDEDDWVEPITNEAKDADEYELLPVHEASNEDYFTDAKPLEVVQNRGLTLKQYQEMTRNVLPYGFTKADTSYNPPSQREGSKFIFLSATNDKQEAPEMRDENGKKRGAFTYALTKIFEVNPAGISFKDAFQKTTNQIKEFGKDITPSARYKPNQREDQNFFGIASEELKLKVYLPSEPCTFHDLNAMYKKWVQPLNSDNYKSEAFNKNNSTCSKIYIINNGKNVFYINGKTKKSHTVFTVNALKKIINGQPYFIYLPVPKILSDSIRKECLKNKKIELVNDMSKADLSLYCTNHSEKSSLISNALDIGKNLTDNIIDYDYKNKLSFVGSNETIGVRRNKPGHSFSSKRDLLMSATEKIGVISKKVVEWFTTKTAK
jgi:hypothetical protein